MKNKRIIIVFVITAILLIIPLIGMQFTDEINWTLFDFIVAGVLLLGAGLTGVFVLRKIKNPPARIAVISVLLIVFILIWLELAVGIFGTVFGGN